MYRFFSNSVSKLDSIGSCGWSHIFLFGYSCSFNFSTVLIASSSGSHTASIAAGRNGIPVRLYGHEFGKASGMAPRAR